MRRSHRGAGAINTIFRARYKVLALAFFIFFVCLRGAGRVQRHSAKSQGSQEVTTHHADGRLRLQVASIKPSPAVLQPLIEAEAAAYSAKSECRLFASPAVKSVAVVGNGPISSEQRAEIATHSIVVRFNFLNNMWREQERIDVWVVRYSFEAKHRFWGFGQMPHAEAKSVLGKSKALWLITSQDNSWAVDELMQHTPEVQQKHWAVIDQGPFLDPSLASDNSNETIIEAPSTGFIGLSTVLSCIPSSVKIHIYGMNWTPKIWKGHSVSEEAKHISRLEKAGRAKVHKTPCNGMRSCEAKELDSDCHFDLKQRFVCPVVAKQSSTEANEGHQGEREFASVEEVIARAAKNHTTYLGNLAETA